MKKKQLLVLVLAMACIAAISITATLAYLTDDTEVVKNTFTVGQIAIDLDEADVDEYGVVESSTRVKANEYKVIPGHQYVKDPTVTIAADSELSYVRMFVTVNCMDTFKAACPNDFVDDVMLIENYVTGWEPTIWLFEEAVVNDDNSTTYEFRYHTTVSTVDAAAKSLEPLFSTIIMPGVLSNTQVETLGENLKIDVVAYAIQADGFESADEAWAEYPAN